MDQATRRLRANAQRLAFPDRTAKLCLVDPKSYLLEATHAALTKPGTALLPHRLLS